MFELKPVLDSLRRIESIFNSFPASLIVIDGCSGKVLGIDDRENAFVNRSNAPVTKEPLNITDLIVTKRTAAELCSYLRSNQDTVTFRVSINRRDGSVHQGTLAFSELGLSNNQLNSPTSLLLVIFGDTSGIGTL